MFSDNVSSADNQQERPRQVRGILRDCMPNISISFGLPTLLGFLYTDGCVSARGSSWRIYFAVKSHTLIRVFGECMRNVFRLKGDKVLIGRTKDGLWRAVVNSKEIGNYLTVNFGCFRTARFTHGLLPDVHLPVDYLINQNGVKEFLTAAFSCDGGVSFYPVNQRRKSGTVRWFNRNVFLACKHPTLLSDYSFLLSHLGIKSSLLADRIKISSRVEMTNFQREVGFIEGVEVTNHSKLWGGLNKSTLLNKTLKSYTNRR